MNLDKPKGFIKKVFGLKKRYETKNAKGKSKTTRPSLAQKHFIGLHQLELEL